MVNGKQLLKAGAITWAVSGITVATIGIIAMIRELRQWDTTNDTNDTQGQFPMTYTDTTIAHSMRDRLHKLSDEDRRTKLLHWLYQINPEPVVHTKNGVVIDVSNGAARRLQDDWEEVIEQNNGSLNSEPVTQWLLDNAPRIINLYSFEHARRLLRRSNVSFGQSN